MSKLGKVRVFIAIVIIPILCYLMGAFGNAELDPRLWTSGRRLIATIMFLPSIIIAILAIIGAYALEKDEQVAENMKEGNTGR